MTTQFKSIADNVITSVASPYSPGNGKIQVTASTAIFPAAPFYLTAVNNVTLARVVFVVTGTQAGNYLTIGGVAPGYVDIALNVGDRLAVTDNAQYFVDIENAI